MQKSINWHKINLMYKFTFQNSNPISITVKPLSLITPIFQFLLFLKYFCIILTILIIDMMKYK